LPVDLIIYAIVAAGLAFWLRGTLGTRQEGDDAPSMRKGLPEIETGDKPADQPALPGFAMKPQNSAAEQIALVKKDKTGVLGIESKTAEIGLTEIIESDRDFDLKFFLSAAQDVFVMVVESFAEGDREALQDLLAPEVYTVFSEALDGRESKKETLEAEIHAIHEAHILGARIEKRMAYITVKFLADQATVARDKDGEIVTGHPERSSRMVDVWTFGRDIKSRDPRWLVYKTHGDFEEDNDIIPDSHSTHDA